MEYYLVGKKWHLEICMQMTGTRENPPEWGNPDPERWTWYVLTHKCILAEKQRILRLQFMILEKLGNKMNPKKSIHRSTSKGEADRISWQEWKHGNGGSREGRMWRQEEKGRGRRTWGTGIVQMEEEQRQEQGKRYFDWGSYYGVARNLALEKFPGILKDDPS